MTRRQLARCFDHTVLKPETSQADVERLCQECVEHGFYCACVNPLWAPLAAGLLAEHDVVVATVAGFPLGATTSEQKAFEALRGVEAGAREIDMVANVAALIAGQRDAVVRDIAAVVESVKRADPDALVKVIVECGALSGDAMILACRCVAEAQADFIKTSTGFHPSGGARVEHVAVLKKHIAPLRVKASGGIRDLSATLALIAVGADRIGSSASVQILAEIGSDR